MAHTITLFAQGAAWESEARLSSPSSLRASRYFISPPLPAAIHEGKCLSSGESATGAMPERSKPAPAADCLISLARSELCALIILLLENLCPQKKERLKFFRDRSKVPRYPARMKSKNFLLGIIAVALLIAANVAAQQVATPPSVAGNND